MRWAAALATGALAAVALAALIFAQNNFDDWQSNRASVLAQIASIERDVGNPNRDRGLAEAHGVMEVMNAPRWKGSASAPSCWCWRSLR